MVYYHQTFCCAILILQIPQTWIIATHKVFGNVKITKDLQELHYYFSLLLFDFQASALLCKICYIIATCYWDEFHLLMNANEKDEGIHKNWHAIIML